MCLKTVTNLVANIDAGMEGKMSQHHGSTEKLEHWTSDSQIKPEKLEEGSSAPGANHLLASSRAKSSLDRSLNRTTDLIYQIWDHSQRSYVRKRSSTRSRSRDLRFRRQGIQMELSGTEYRINIHEMCKEIKDGITEITYSKLSKSWSKPATLIRERIKYNVKTFK